MGAEASHEKGVSDEQLRRPRLSTEEWLAGKTVMPCNHWERHSRWFQAHAPELRRWKDQPPHTMMETVQAVRKELAGVPALFAPAGYTTIVEGRPVQACAITYSPFES